MNTARTTTIRPPRTTTIRPPRTTTSASGTFPAVRAKSSPPPRAKKHAGFTHMGFRVTDDHAEIVRAGAAAKGVPVSEYLRDIALEWAAADAGISRPDTRVYDYRNVVESAARSLGMSVRQYEAHCARELATQHLGIK